MGNRVSQQEIDIVHDSMKGLTVEVKTLTRKTAEYELTQAELLRRQDQMQRRHQQILSKLDASVVAITDLKATVEKQAQRAASSSRKIAELTRQVVALSPEDNDVSPTLTATATSMLTSTTSTTMSEDDLRKSTPSAKLHTHDTHKTKTGKERGCARLCY
jgi:uncharacterized protein YoxC